MKKTLLISTACALAILINSNAYALSAAEIAGEALICVYGEKYGGSESEECKAPLARYYDIEKKTGGFTKKFSCELTKIARKAFLSQAIGNEWPLDDIVSCNRK